MALVCGDIHGNFGKASAFLKYKPEEKHIFVGDYMDSYNASTELILNTFEMIMKSGAVVIVGNHELHYLPFPHPYFRCSGFRDYEPVIPFVLKSYLDRMVPCYVEDSYLISHGGLSKWHGKPFISVDEAAQWINSEWEWYIKQPTVPMSLSPIFDVGSVRGGRQQNGGIFWCSIGHEKMDTRFNQVVGHTPHKDPVKMIVHKKPNQRLHIGIDCPKYLCFNTKTAEFEDFMPVEFKGDEQMRKIIEKVY